MDEEQKLKYKEELERRIEKLWDDFLAGMHDLGYESAHCCQELRFHNSNYSKVDMRGALILRVPEHKKDAKF